MGSSNYVINGFWGCLAVFFCFSLIASGASGDPNIVIDPNVLSFSAFEGEGNPADQFFTISNGAEGTLNWSIDTAGQPAWLSLASTGGSLDPNESEPVTLSVDITGLSGGQYSYSFNVTDPAATNSPQTVTVELEVVGPILNVPKTDFAFTAYVAGSNPDNQLLIITNSGGGTLNWTADLSDKPDWLNVTPQSGSLSSIAPELVTLSVDITGLPGGQYSYSFGVTDPTASNSPQTVTVELEVVGPMLDVSNNDFAFTAYEAGSDPDNQSLIITNSGGGTLNWTADLSGKPDWLNVTPTGGSLAYSESESVSLSVDITDLSGGQYSYSFDVTDSASTNSPQSVIMQLGVFADLLGCAG